MIPQQILEVYSSVIPIDRVVDEKVLPDNTINHQVIETIEELEKNNITALIAEVNFNTHKVVLSSVAIPQFIDDDRVYNTIAKITGFSLDQIKTKSRIGELVYARQLMQFAFRAKTKYNLHTIGNRTGKDHATVLHSVKVIRNILETKDKKHYDKLQRVCQMLSIDAIAFFEAYDKEYNKKFGNKDW